MPRIQKPTCPLPSVHYPPTCGVELYWMWPKERRNIIPIHNNYKEHVRIGTVHTVRENTIYSKAPPGSGRPGS